MQYKGYTAEISFDEESVVLYGEVIGLRDAIMFYAKSADEIKGAFHEAVDTYLEYCRSRGEEPERPYSGKFLVRVDPDIHRKAAMKARSEGVSLNAWLENVLTDQISGGKNRITISAKANELETSSSSVTDIVELSRRSLDHVLCLLPSSLPSPAGAFVMEGVSING